MDPLQTILKKYWGYDRFRPMQQAIIQSVLDGQDVLAVLPTGGGKSICFQVPAMMMDGICLVVTPLIALMKDQVENLERRGIHALAIHSGMNYHDTKRTLQNAAFGNYKFLYVSPERLETDLFDEFLPSIYPSLIAIDEAHCISQWGYDFRPAYLRIARIREEMPETPVIALTASATQAVQQDICEKLLFKENKAVFKQSFHRPNLAYSVLHPASKQHELVQLITALEGCGIVYCRSRKRTIAMAEALNQQGCRADYYHAGLDHATRSAKQTEWKKGVTRVMVCTNAFGMGIDKPDVRFVIHTDLPESLEHYYQEAGRAGRDGEPARAILMCDQSDHERLLSMHALRYPEPGTVRQFYLDLMNHLQIAAGIGEDTSYVIDMTHFATAFQWSSMQAQLLIRYLEDEQLICFSEGYAARSTVVFTANRAALDDFEKSQPMLFEMASALLRTYGGILTEPAYISEKQLARVVRLPETAITNSLKQLHRYRIIEYRPGTDQATITLLKNRMYRDDLRFDTQALLFRKEQDELRMKAMLSYVETDTCRSVFIGHYFGDDNQQVCGVCDRCLARPSHNTAIQDSFFYKQFESALAHGEKMAVRDLLQVIPAEHQRQGLTYLNWLEAEGKIGRDEQQQLHWIV